MSNRIRRVVWEYCETEICKGELLLIPRHSMSRSSREACKALTSSKSHVRPVAQLRLSRLSRVERKLQSEDGHGGLQVIGR